MDRELWAVPTVQAGYGHSKTGLVEGGDAEVGRGESLDPVQTLGFMPHLVHSGESFQDFKKNDDMAAEFFLKIALDSVENRSEGDKTGARETRWRRAEEGKRPELRQERRKERRRAC